MQFQDLAGEAILTVNGTATMVSGVPVGPTASQIRIGNDIFAPNTRYFKGDIDEVRVASIPEPFIFGLAGLVGLLAFRK